MKLPIKVGFTKRLLHVDRHVIFIHFVLLVICLETEASLAENFMNDEPSNVTNDLKLSTPEECARTCHLGEPPKICYYHFTVEMYNTMGGACNICTPNNTNEVTNHCQCIQTDGVERGVLSVNRMIPGPSIQVCEGDKVVIDVSNKMEGMELTIHWHGVLQKGSQYYDGVPFVTQCPINQYETFRYQWHAGNSGTHFWHAHTGLQKLDGIFGTLVVREPVATDPHGHLYDYDDPDHVVVISDWMHEYAMEHFPGLIVRSAQLPESLLINGKGRYTYPNGTRTKTPYKIFSVKAGHKYRFRMVNSFCTVCPAAWRIEGHKLDVIATDGEPVKPVTVHNIISLSGERYDFVIHANQPPGDYWIQLRGLGECATGDMQQLGILRYEGHHRKLLSAPPSYNISLYDGVLLNPLDGVCSKPRKDAICVNQLKSARPVDTLALTENAQVKIVMPFRFFDYDQKELFKPDTYDAFLVAPSTHHLASIIDGISFESPPSPPLSQRSDIPNEQFCNGQNMPKNCTEPCSCTHLRKIPLNSIVELCMVDEIGAVNLTHPFHMHGYSFYVIATGRSPDATVEKISVEHVLDLDRRGLIHRTLDKPPKKDTLAVPDNGYACVRFRADNPGYWLFHCHFLYHIAIGMNVVLHVGEVKDLPPVPEGFPKCGSYLPPITP